jgi:DNA-binding GntR family transcriptional regulator
MTTTGRRRPIPITPLQRQTLEEKVYEAVRESIISGELRPGDPLVEAQLSADMGISKTPVREALIRLTRDGLVEQEQHRRSRVATPTLDDVHQACELRRWVEGAIAADAARAPDADLVQRLEETIVDGERALKRRDARRWAVDIEAFTNLLVEHSGNRHAAELLDRMGNVLSLIANVSQGAPGRQARSLEEHRAILEAIRAGDPDAAAQATERHLRSIEDDSVRALEQVDAAAS